jgi:TonB family protein
MTRPEFPEYPAIAVGQGIDGQALIVFTLASDGNLKGASIAQTSGNQWLDQAALYAVKKSRYEAAVHDCSRVGGTYGVEVGFSTQSLMPVNGFAGAGGRHPIK